MEKTQNYNFSQTNKILENLFFCTIFGLVRQLTTTVEEIKKVRKYKFSMENLMLVQFFKENMMLDAFL